MSRILLSCFAFFLCISQINAQDSLRSALKRYDYAAAVNIIDSLMTAAAPDSVSALAKRIELIDLALQKSQCQKKLQRFDDAVQTITSVLGFDRYNIELMAELADCYMNIGDMESAMMFYTMLAGMQPENVYFKLCKARIQYRMKSYSEVLAECKKILALDTIPDVLYMTGNCYKQIGQLDSAMVYYDTLLDINPLNANAISQKSDIMFARNNYDAVLAMTDPYLKEFPSNLKILPLRGLALYLKKDYEKSLETFQYQKELGDESYTVHYYVGMNNYLLSRWSKASEAFASAYQIDSSDVRLVCRLADSYSHISDKDSLSTVYFDKAIAMMRPDSTLMKTIYDRKAEMAVRTNDFLKAIDYYEFSYIYGKTNISALSSIGYCYERLKDYRNALHYYEANKKIDEFRKEINNINIQMIKFSLFGETILEWNDKDIEHYHAQRMAMDSMLCRFKATYPAERIDSVRHLLEDKERQMCQIVQILEQQ